MDEMNLKVSSNFMKNIIAKLIAKFLSKQLGCQLDVFIREINIVHDNGLTHIHANVDAEITDRDFVKLVKHVE
jgi:hypothetical protein